MARDHARIAVSIWNDPDFRSLPIYQQWTYFMLVTNPTLSWCGSLDYIPRRLAVLAHDASPETIQHGIDGLEFHRFVLRDLDTSELLVRSYVRHDGIFKQPNIVKAMLRARGRLLSFKLREALDTEIVRAYQDDPESRGIGVIETLEPDLWETLSGTLPGGPR